MDSFIEYQWIYFVSAVDSITLLCWSKEPIDISLK